MDKKLCKENLPDFDTKNYFAIKEYFSKPDNNKFSPSVIHNQELNISVMVHFCLLESEQLKKIHLEVEQTILQFKEYFDLSSCISIKPTIFNMFVFNNKDDYDCFTDPREVISKTNGGRAYYVGRNDSHSEIYLYHHHGVNNLKHELAHALTFYVTKGNFRPLPIVLIEGIAEYFEKHRGILSIDKNDYKYIMSEDLMKLSYSKVTSENISIYRVGHAIVSYLQNKKAGVINKIFTSLREGDIKKFNELCAEISDTRAIIKNWMYENSLELIAKRNNFLFIKNEPLKIIKMSQLSAGSNHYKYSTAFITDHSDKIVGEFSHTVHVWIKQHLYSIDSTTKLSILIDPNYYFIKMINKNEFAYCNRYGELYKNSATYKSKISSLVYNKIPNISARKNLLNEEEREAHYAYKVLGDEYFKFTANYISMKFLAKNDSGIATFSKLADKYHDLGKAENNLCSIMTKNKNFNKEFYDYFSGEKYWPDPVYKSIFKNAPYKIIKETILCYNELIRISLRQIKRNHQSDNIQDIFRDKVISVNRGAGENISPALLCEANQKIAELSTQVGFFELDQDLEYNKNFFVFEDLLNTKEPYSNTSPILSLVKNKDNYSLELVGKIFANNFYKEKISYFYNIEEYKIGTHNFFECDLNKLVANKTMRATNNCTKILNGKVYSKDVNIRQQPDLSQRAISKSKSFYLSPEIRCAKWNLIIHGALFIEDHIENRRWHLPSKFNHLKLKKISPSEIKLVPTDQYGNEHHQALKHIPEHYRHISPHHVHIRPSSQISSDKLECSLLDLTSYQSDTLFFIKPDLGDMESKEINFHTFNKNTPLNIQLYQVKLYYNGEEIGVLNNRFYTDENKNFISNKILSAGLPFNNHNKTEIKKEAGNGVKEKDSLQLHDNLVYATTSLSPQREQFSSNSIINEDSSAGSSTIGSVPHSSSLYERLQTDVI